MSRALAALILGAALWLSSATFAPVSADGSWRVVLAGLPALAAALAAAALAVAFRPPRTLFALLPLIGVLLPWVPGIDAGLVYAGPLVLLIWTAVIALGWGGGWTAWLRRCGCAASPARATAAALLIALASTALAAWRVAPMRPGGDEPHYLIITQSLMKDGDLRIENNHAARDFDAYTAGVLHPQYLTRGKDAQIYPIHAPGLPALVLPAFAAGGYTGVVVFLLIVMACASALVWRLAWMASGDIGAAWFGWAVVAASATWVFQSFLVFPEALGGAAVACGLWLVLRLDRGETPSAIAIAGVGAALALLPWLHTRFAVLAAGLGLMVVLRLWRGGPGAVARFLAAPVAAAAAWFAMFFVIYGTPSPLAPWGGPSGNSLAWIPTGLAGVLLDQQFGVLPYAPALVAGIAGLITGTAAGWRRATRLQILLLLVVPYLAATTSYAMWWGGFSVPARLLTALLPLLAPAAAVAWQRTRSTAVRAALASALAWTIFATVTLVFVGRGALVWNVRQSKTALWFEWVAPLMRWTESLPAFFRADDALGRESLPVASFYVAALVWCGVLAAAILAAALVTRRLRGRAEIDDRARLRAQAIAVTCLILAVPAATVLALRAQGADGAAPGPAQMAFLSRLAQRDAVVVNLGRIGEPGARLLVADPERTAGFRMVLPARRAGGRQVALSAGPVPAGTYRIAAEPAGTAGQIAIGRSVFPIAALGDAPVEITLPAPVAAIEVRGADGRTVTLEPVAVPLRRSRQPVLRAARYGAVTAYFLDEGVYSESASFWVRGAARATVILQADPGLSSAMVEITNGAVPNRVSVTGADAPAPADLAPGQSISVRVTFDERGSARLRMETSSGFVPADVIPGSEDRRFLGVSVRFR